MSVDTHLKGKRITGRYRTYSVDGAQILVAHSLVDWAQAVRLEARRGVFGKRVKARVEHRHRPT